MKNLKEKIDEISKFRSITISGLNEGEKAFLPFLFSSKSVVISSIDNIERYEEVLSSLGKRVLCFDDKLPLLISSGENLSEVFKTYYVNLSLLAQNDYDVLILSPQALFQKLPNKKDVLGHNIKLVKGKSYSLEDLTKSLVSMGYRSQDLIYEKGDFSRRGDLLDIYPINSEYPVRISFFDDEIECINFFDKNTFKLQKEINEINVLCNSFLFSYNVEELEQKIREDLSKLSLAPDGMLRASEIVSEQIEALKENVNYSSVFFLPYVDYFASSFFDYIDKNNFVFIDEPKLIQDSLSNVEDENISSFLSLSLKGEFLPKHMGFYLEKKNILKSFQDCKLIAYTRLISQNKLFVSDHLVNFICPHVDRYVGKFSDLCEDIKNYLRNGYTIALVAGSDLTKNKLKNFFEDNNLQFNLVNNIEKIVSNAINVLMKGPEHSIHFEMEKFLLIGAHDLNNRNQAHKVKSLSEESTYVPQVGEYVVHEVHGIGKCLGIKNMKITNLYRDYIVIEYAGGDLLYLPSENVDMISRYSSQEEPKCNKIGGTEFFKIKQKVKSSIKKMAFDLIKVYSERLNSKGFVYSKDSYLQEAFEDAFGFEYTEDQVRCINEIKADMESTRIMDRLVCGDVGFGKTEVALVAAFKAIQDGKQVAIICPTTILCEQHYATALERMKKFFVSVEAINRFKTKKQQGDILSRLAEGKIDLICGTHRLLSNDVKFKDLGLVIIDEEQRFGVEDKDKLKNIKKTIDVLSLSATPIPRTLYMSLSGMRDVSFLSTPPKQRKRIKTAVIDYSDAMLVEACKKELERGGQVLIVYNRVDTISNFYAHVKNLLPDANIGFAHGQMPTKMLEKAIFDLYSRKTNVLISTILIENGIDLPYANTLFVIDSDKLGLSQLYQLRGRIGRSNVEAYAYFSFKRNKVLTIDSYKRLDAIMEFSDFGSGYKIAMRDLEIRGAGDVLGRFQHGHMQQVGYDMYIKLLGEAVKELKGESLEEKRELKIDISLSAYVPDNFIASSENRISLYMAISKVKTLEELNAFVQKIKEKYSSIPKPVEQLCKVGLIKNLGQNVLAKQIVVGEFGSKVIFYNDIVGTELYDFLSKDNVEFLLNKDKLPIVTLKKEPNLEKMQENLIKFLLDCQKYHKG